MTPWKSILVPVVALLLGTVPVAAQVQQFVGTWRNIDRSANSLTTLRVERAGIAVLVRAWGKCLPSDCSWGVAPAGLFTDTIRSDPEQTARVLCSDFVSAASETRLILRPAPDGQLHVDVLRRYLDASGRSNVSLVATFARVDR